MKRLAAILAVVGTVAILATCGESRSSATHAPVSPQVIKEQLVRAGLDIPRQQIMSKDFTLPGLQGATISLSSFKGRVVLLSFWATWCGPCKIEMPEMEALYRQLKPKGFVILAVDLMEDKSTVASFIKTNGYTFPVLLDSRGEVGGADMYSAGAIPTNYIIDRAGRIVGRKIGVDGPSWTSPERTALLQTLLSQ